MSSKKRSRTCIELYWNEVIKTTLVFAWSMKKRAVVMGKFYYDFKIDDEDFIRIKDLPDKVELLSVPREKQEEKYYSYALHDIGTKDATSYLEKALQVGDVIKKEVLFEAAVIKCAKCFTSSKSGRKQLIPSKVYNDVQGGPLEYHMKLREMRDPYTAHDQNDFLTVRTGLVLQDGELKGVVCPPMQSVFYYGDNINILLALCETTCSFVENILNEEINKTHEKYKDERDIKVIKSFPKMKEH